MNVDVIYFFGFHFCIFQRICHYQFGSQTFRVGSCQVMRIGRHTYAGNLCINLGTTCFSVFQFFKNQTAAAFTHDETVTACAERAGCSLRRVIAGR